MVLGGIESAPLAQYPYVQHVPVQKHPMMMTMGMQTPPPPNQCAVSGPLYKRAFTFNGYGKELDIKSFLELYEVPNDSYGHNMRNMTVYPVQRGESGNDKEVLDLKLMETASTQRVPETASSPTGSQTHESLVEQGQCSNPFCPRCLSDFVASQGGEQQAAEHHHQNGGSNGAVEVLSSPFNKLEMTSETQSPQSRAAREEFEEARTDPVMSPPFRPTPGPSQPMMWNPSGLGAAPFQPRDGLPEFPDPDDLSIQGLLNEFMAFDPPYHDRPYQDSGCGDGGTASSPSHSSSMASPGVTSIPSGDKNGASDTDSLFTAISSPRAHVSSADSGIRLGESTSSDFTLSPPAVDVKPFQLPPTYEPAPGLPPVRDKTDEEQDRPLHLGCGIEVTEHQVVDMPVHELNRLLYQSKLTEAEISLVKETRRRGKNKVAARNCRKRKLDTISELEKEVEELKGKKAKLAEEKASMEKELQTYKEKTEALTRFILERVKDDSGLTLNSDEFSLEKSEDGRLFVLHKLRTANGKTVAVVA